MGTVYGCWYTVTVASAVTVSMELLLLGLAPVMYVVYVVVMVGDTTRLPDVLVVPPGCKE